MSLPEYYRAELIAITQQHMIPELRRRMNAAWEYEKANGQITGDGFDKVTVGEIVEVITGFLDSDVKTAYDVLAQVNESGLSYYDLLIAPQHISAHEALAEAFKINEPERAKLGLDIGTGTGNTAVVLAGICADIVGIDPHRGMLDIAETKLEGLKVNGELQSFSLFQAGITDDEFSRVHAGKFDIVVGNGIAPYLTLEEVSIKNRNIARLLNPGGRYYQNASNIRPGFDRSPYDASPKARLVSMASGFLVSLTHQGVNGLRATAGMVDPKDIADLEAGWDLFKTETLVVQTNFGRTHEVDVHTKKTQRAPQGVNQGK